MNAYSLGNFVFDFVLLKILKENFSNYYFKINLISMRLVFVSPKKISPECNSYLKKVFLGTWYLWNKDAAP